MLVHILVQWMFQFVGYISWDSLLISQECAFSCLYCEHLL